MLRYKTKTRPGLVALYRCTTSGQETERVHSYNPGARMGPSDQKMIGSILSPGSWSRAPKPALGGRD